jgi:hypothetical protein
MRGFLQLKSIFSYFALKSKHSCRLWRVTTKICLVLALSALVCFTHLLSSSAMYTFWKYATNNTVIMVNPTPGGELARQLQNVVSENPGPVKIKIQEQGGVKISNRLQRTNPNKTKGCSSNECIVCKHGRGQK